MKFYPDVKEHMSPTSLDMWINNRSAFIKSYFEGEKFKGNAATRAGKSVHALIEGGMIEAKHVYDESEVQILVEMGDGKRFLGIPDSNQRKAENGHISFVDYKTGKENGWKEKLPKDLKMKATAWLVWKMADEPKYVHGWIEYIPTEWNGKEVVPIEGAESEEIPINYDEDDLRGFTKVIVKAMDEVNEFYEKWKDSTSDFVNVADLGAYIDLDKQKKAIEEKMAEVKERIMGQMEFGGKDTLTTDGGTFYTTTRKTYEYPSDLSIKVGTEVITLDYADEVASATSAAKKNYEVTTTPKSVSKSLGFRAAKEIK